MPRSPAHPHARRSRRGPAFWLLTIAGVLLLALVIDGVWSTLTVTREVRVARDELERAADQLEAGEVEQARVSFAGAREAADAAAGAAGHPSARLAGLLPWLGDDVDAVRTLGRATALASQAGEVLATAAADAGWDGQTIPGYEAGRLDPGVIQAAEPALQEAAGLLREAEALIAPLDPLGKLGAIGEAIRTADEQVGERARQAERAALVARLLPGFLGADGPRTYGIVMMTLSDPRGSGGYPGSYGVLRVDDGRFELEELAPTGDLGRVRPVVAPDDVVRRYERFGGLTHFIASTYSPDWPTSARIWMQMWEASGREPLDGVIGADSVWMRYVLEAIGPVQTPVWPDPITAENVSQIADADTMRTLDREQSNLWQAGIATALWEATVTRPLAPEAFGSALSRGTAERHLQVYSADPGQEAMLDELGAAGRLTMPPNPLAVSWSGFSDNRTGYFAEKAIDYQATVNLDRTVDVTVTVTLTNRAPTEPESILLGTRDQNFPVGTYVAAASVYLPTDATRIRSEVDDGPPLVKLFEREFDRRVVLTVMVADSGQTTTATISYQAPAPASGFRLDVVPQPELRPTPVTVAVTFDDGRTIVATSPGATVDGSTLRYEGLPTTPVAVWARTDA